METKEDLCLPQCQSLSSVLVDDRQHTKCAPVRKGVTDKSGPNAGLPTPDVSLQRRQAAATVSTLSLPW
jgi:hypothetical protein